MNIRNFESYQDCASALAVKIALALRTRLDDSQRVTLALSGGRSPRQVLPYLARSDVKWTSVDLTLTDDRCVSDSDEFSNARLIKKYFFEKGASGVCFTPLWDNTLPPQEMSTAVAAANARLSEVNWPLDVAYLGMGEDGHFASLFPASDVSEFGEGDAVCVAGMAPQEPRHRISLSLPVLLASRHIFLHVTGAAKFKALKAAMDMQPTPEFPISLLVHSGHPNLEILYAP